MSTAKLIAAIISMWSVGSFAYVFEASVATRIAAVKPSSSW
jgi:hypothetical protein